MTIFYKKQFTTIYARVKKTYNSPFFAPSVVLIAMLFITYWSWRASVVTLNRDVETIVTDRMTQTKNDLTGRLTSYEEILTGGAGLIRGSQEVLQTEWHDYVSTFDIAGRYPGIQGIGFSKVFSALQLPNVVSNMQEQGIDFHISPDTPRENYSAIVLFDPTPDVNVFGIDMLAEPNRMRSMIRAQDGGQTVITPPLKSLWPDTKQLILTIYVPQYKSGAALKTVSERQQSIQGYVYARIKSQDFFNELSSNDLAGNAKVFRLDSHDNPDSSEALYQTHDYVKLSSQPGRINRRQTVNVFGQTWDLNYSFKISDILPAQRRNTPTWTLLAGLLVSFLLAEVVYLLLKAKSQELVNLKEEAVDLAKDELLSLASHQLRTPATTVKQYLGMVLQGFAGDITPTQTSLLDKAYSGNERQLYIINEMLHVAKVDSGRIVLARHETDINSLLSDIVQEAHPEADNLNHKVTLKLPKKSLKLNIDEHMLRMSIENLVSNAIKYTLPGGKIKISLQKLKDSARIEVRDNGIGINQNDLAKLYKLFSRLDNPLTQNVGGTGVGLYLAKHLIELHDGSLHVVSKPGQGSTFTVVLPLGSLTIK